MQKLSTDLRHCASVIVGRIIVNLMLIDFICFIFQNFNLGEYEKGFF